MAIAKLGPVVRKTKASNRFCGPAIISALTGADTAEIAKVMRHVTGRKMITGSHTNEVNRVLQLYGLELVNGQTACKTETGQLPTLTRWLKDTPRPAGTVYLVSAGNHWQLVSGRRYVCGISKEVVSIRDKVVKRRSRVRAHWVVRAYRKIGLDPEIKRQLTHNDKRRRDEKRSTYGSARTAKQIIKQLGLDWDQESDARSEMGFSGWLFPNPAWNMGEDDGQEPDPWCGDHFCTSWEEVLDKANGYMNWWQEQGRHY